MGDAATKRSLRRPDGSQSEPAGEVFSKIRGPLSHFYDRTSGLGTFLPKAIRHGWGVVSPARRVGEIVSQPLLSTL